jgi:hypothetical protein
MEMTCCGIGLASAALPVLVSRISTCRAVERASTMQDPG